MKPAINKFFLAGGGLPEKSKEIDLAFVQSLPANPRVLYIPLARDGTEKPLSLCKLWFSSVYGPLGIQNVTMLEHPDTLSTEEILKFDAIYLGGGNTYRLLHTIRHSILLTALPSFAALGKPIYGGSAGAIVLGKSIETASFDDCNDIGVTTTEGLDLLDGYSVLCHYQEGKIHFKRFTQQKILCIPETGGIIVREDEQTFHIVGDTCFVYTDILVPLPLGIHTFIQ